MRLILWIIVMMLPPLGALGAEHERGESGIRSLLTKHKAWIMYWEITDAQQPSERANKLKYEFFERDQKLMARMIVEYGGCEFEVPLRSDGIELRYCSLPGEPSLTFDPGDTEYPFKERTNPRKLWLTPNLPRQVCQPVRQLADDDASSPSPRVTNGKNGSKCEKCPTRVAMSASVRLPFGFACL